MLNVGDSELEFAVAKFFAAVSIPLVSEPEDEPQAEPQEIFSVEILAQGGLTSPDDLLITVDNSNAALLNLIVDPDDIIGGIRDAVDPVLVEDGVVQLTNHAFLPAPADLDFPFGVSGFFEGLQVGALIVAEPSTAALGAIAAAAMFVTGWRGRRRSRVKTP